MTSTTFNICKSYDGFSKGEVVQSGLTWEESINFIKNIGYMAGDTLTEHGPTFVKSKEHDGRIVTTYMST